MSLHLPFQQSRNFCGIKNYDFTQRYVVVGAPTDCATTFRSGSRMGPGAVRDVSLMLTDGAHEKYPVNLREFVGDAGDMALPTGNVEAALEEIYSNAFSFRGHHLVTIGGDHSITLGLLRAIYAARKEPVAVVHFDAHCDTWSDHFGQPYGHGTWMFNAIEQGLIDPAHTISIGIRSPSDSISRNYLREKGGATISAKDAMMHNHIMMSDIIRAKIGDKPCYLSLDIDCLDPAYAPGTGTPEIAGLTTMWLSSLIDQMQKINWIGMDVVEVAPAYDHSQITALAAATFIWQYLSMNISKTG